ncbi:MAG: putative motility protein [Dorea sp.]|jgi:hypothetical protein|nr:putative motility protein [Dorea sp.]MCI9248212.1 putative motility protein [Dorea sp.]
MDVSDIAMASMSMSSAKLQVSASIAVTKNAMNAQEAAAAQLLEMLPSSPGLGQLVDVRA